MRLSFFQPRRFGMLRYTFVGSTLLVVALKEWNLESGERVDLLFQGVHSLDLRPGFWADRVTDDLEVVALYRHHLPTVQSQNHFVVFLHQDAFVGCVDAAFVHHTVDHRGTWDHPSDPLMDRWFGPGSPPATRKSSRSRKGN